jgi:hypothetical protein
VRREPFIRRIKPDDSGRVLDPKRIRKFYLLMTPVLIPILTIAAGAYVIWGSDLPDAETVGGITVAGGFVLLFAYVVFETYFISHYPARSYLRWLRERIDRRPDAVVKADDPDAFFVQIIPRENWTMTMGENASDVGLLRVDPTRGELRYEGDLERWVIPAESVISFKLQTFTPPGGRSAMNGFWVVELIVELDDDVPWETPLATQAIHFERWSPAKRWRGAELLRRVVGHVVDPERWPKVDPEELWPLRPPGIVWQ